MATKSTKDSGLETLSGVDGAFLNLETAATPMHVGSLHLFETPPGFKGSFYKVVRGMMESRLVPVLRRRLAALPLHLANPVWLQGEVDLDYHIRRVRWPAPCSTLHPTLRRGRSRRAKAALPRPTSRARWPWLPRLSVTTRRNTSSWCANCPAWSAPWLAL